MAFGTELILGFSYKKKKTFKYFCENIFLNTPSQPSNLLDLIKRNKRKSDEEISNILQFFDEKLKIAHINALSEIGVKIINTKPTIIGETKYGKREFNVF